MVLALEVVVSSTLEPLAVAGGGAELVLYG